jgi:hypothetical protein
MRFWDLDRQLLFPKPTVVAYVSNLLHFAGCSVDVRRVLLTFPDCYTLEAVGEDGKEIELIAPYTSSSYRRMYIPFVFQKGFRKSAPFRWAEKGRSCENCFKIAEQRDGNEFWLMTSKNAVISYARSGRIPLGYFEAKAYPGEVKDFISEAMQDEGIEDSFRFANWKDETVVVPFLPVILNPTIEMEKRRYGGQALPAYAQKDRYR